MDDEEHAVRPGLGAFAGGLVAWIAGLLLAGLLSACGASANGSFTTTETGAAVTSTSTGATSTAPAPTATPTPPSSPIANGEQAVTCVLVYQGHAATIQIAGPAGDVNAWCTQVRTTNGNWLPVSGLANSSLDTVCHGITPAGAAWFVFDSGGHVYGQQGCATLNQMGLAPATAAVPAVQPAAARAVLSDCTGDLATLQNDIDMDRGAAEVAGPNQAAYVAYVNQWTRLRSLVLADCGRTLPAGAIVPTCNEAIGWLAVGVAGHVNDAARANATADDKAWDASWAAFYQRLSREIAKGCP